MTHKLGYQRITATDPAEEILRAEWYKAKSELVAAGNPDTGAARHHFNFVDSKLCDYIWTRAEKQVAEDRAKHPKAKRNLPVPQYGESTRHLP